jgi:hypothetical protein
MKNFIVIFLLFINTTGLAQDSLEFEFDKSRALLAQRKVNEAINSLRKIYVSKPDIGNINFLMGAAYAETPGKEKEAIYHLKKALPFVSEEYMVGSYKETNAPIHTYYYLTKSFVEQNRCAEARLSLDELKKHNKFIDDYFIAEGERNLQKCPFDPEKSKNNLTEVEAIPEGYNPLELEKEVVIDSSELARRGIFTKKLHYTTNAPLYGVQIGSNKTPVPVNNFNEVNNVDVFVDTEGIIRYVVGHFSYKKQAEKLLKSLYLKGYQDAFIVNVNNERKYSNEIISYQNINLKAGIIGDVLYFVQLGAFQQEIPDSIINLYHDIEDMAEIPYNNMTLLLVGPFTKYDESTKMKDRITQKGIRNSFVVAFNNGKKISLKEAINHTK